MHNLPNFILPGFSRTATTWLHQNLSRHSQVFLPHDKELHFFDTNFENGIEWYKSKFKDSHNEKIIGDITPSYILQKSSASRIKSILGKEIKIVIFIRNPLERLYSIYLKDLRAKNINMKFEEFFTLKRDYLKMHLYYENIIRYLELFPVSNIHFDTYENFKNDKKQFILKIFKFMEIDNEIENINFNMKNNKTYNPKNILLHRNLLKINRILKYKINIDKIGIYTSLINIYKKRYTNNNIPAISSDIKKRIIDFCFEDIQKTSKIFNIDLIQEYGFND